MARVLVFDDEPAERHVVARGVLDALQDAVLAQRDEHRGIELGVHAHGQVVREQRQVSVLADRAEVALGLLGAAQRVERRGRHDGVDAEALGALGLVDHAHGLHVDDAGEHGNALVDDGDRLLQHVVALSVGEEGDLARGAQEEQAVDACGDHAVDGALERLQVQMPICRQRNDYRGDDAAKR